MTNVLVPSDMVKTSAAPWMVAVTPAVLLPPTTSMAFNPEPPPTAAPTRLLAPRINVPVSAPAVEVTAPSSELFGDRLIVPSAWKTAVGSFAVPLSKFTAPVPVTKMVVA